MLILLLWYLELGKEGSLGVQVGMVGVLGVVGAMGLGLRIWEAERGRLVLE